MIYISGSWCVLSSRLPKHWHYYRLRYWHQTFSALLLCGCHVTSTFQKLPQEWVAPKVCAAGTEGYREEEASSPQQHSWQLELQLFKGILPLLTWHSGRWKASSLVPLWNKSSAVSDVHVIQDSRYGAVEVQQLFKISPALNVYVKGACSGECTGESLLHIFNASFADIFTIFCRCGSLVRMCESAVRAKRSLAWLTGMWNSGPKRCAWTDSTKVFPIF